jgi:hypothetical protein
MNNKIDIQDIIWVQRFPPLKPRMAVCRGIAALRMARLLEERPQIIGQLRGAAAPGFFSVMGESGNLPWVNGVQYLGINDGVSEIYLPVNMVPEFDETLFCDVVKKKFQKGFNVLGIMINPFSVFSVVEAGELSLKVLPYLINIISRNEK